MKLERIVGYIFLPVAVAAGGIYVYLTEKNVRDISESLSRYTEAKAYEKRMDNLHTEFQEKLQRIDETEDTIEKMLLQRHIHGRPENGTPIPNFPDARLYNPMPRFDPDTRPPSKLIPPYRGGARLIPQKR